MSETVTVTINGRRFAVFPDIALSYRDVVDLVRMSGQPTVTVFRGAAGKVLTPSEAVMPQAGLVFNVVHTQYA